eukprot:16216773-Heterocapsa_arctica.AAC.1
MSHPQPFWHKPLQAPPTPPPPPSPPWASVGTIGGTRSRGRTSRGMEATPWRTRRRWRRRLGRRRPRGG